jgi:hypothetical protein
MKKLIWTVIFLTIAVGAFLYFRSGKQPAEPVVSPASSSNHITNGSHIVDESNQTSSSSLVTQGSSNSVVQPRTPGSDAGLGALSTEEQQTIQTWFKKDDSIQGAKTIANICLKHQLTMSSIVSLIGEPSFFGAGSNSVSYNFAPNQLLEFRFGPDGRILSAFLTGEQL